MVRTLLESSENNVETGKQRRLDLLSDQKVALRVLEKLVQLENVRVIHLLQDADLGEELLLGGPLQVLLVDYLDCSERICLLRKALPHLAVRAYIGQKQQRRNHTYFGSQSAPAH